MADLNVVPFRPRPEDYVWTFGGVEPVMKVKPGDILEEMAAAYRAERGLGER